MYQPVQNFVSHARSKGLDHATIHLLLHAAGWKEKDIAGAIASESLDLPVPEPVSARNARDAFLYLLTFTALYITVSSVILLFYSYLDYLYPDPAWNWSAEPALETIRYAIAAIVVAFPLFVLLSTLLDRSTEHAPDGRLHPTRRWLTYLTLFLAAAIMMGDVITLLYYFLAGDMTTRFVLKVVVLLVIAQVVFSYYFLSPRSATKDQPTHYLRQFLVAAALVIVAGSLGLGFTMAGSPFTARLQRLDEKRVNDLRGIHRVIQQMVTKVEYGSVKFVQPLPKSLEEVAEYQRTRESGAALDLSDPTTGEKYDYRATGEKTYELCATFEFARDRKYDLFWNHPAGRHCFKFNAESPP